MGNQLYLSLNIKDGYYSGKVKISNKKIILDGEGKIKLNNGDMYIGNFKENMFEGEGSYITKDGFIYYGNWLNDHIEKGTIRYNGHIYKGPLKDYYPHNIGKLFFKDGKKYIGCFNYGIIESCGTLYDKDDKILYNGIWKNNLPHGEGFVDGNKVKMNYGHYRIGDEIRIINVINPFTSNIFNNNLTCKVCYSKEKEIMFSPCNHIVCCKECSDFLEKCPICNVNIEIKIEFYMS